MNPEPPESPLLEFDPTPVAFLDPSLTVRPIDTPAACVVTFLGSAFQRLRQSAGARVLAENEWEDGPHPLLEIEHEGRKVAVLHSGVGAPLAAGLLEQVIAMGCRAFVVCGGAGALRADLVAGHLIVVDSAVRDEGTSHHYAPARRVVAADPRATEVLTEVLTEQGLPFVQGRTWTTDAPYRETPAKIAARREEGCVTVDMEASALMTVAAFRGVPLAQLLYAGDDLSGDLWDHRDWRSQHEVRDQLLRLSATAALRLADLSA